MTWSKRAFDLALASIALVLLSPLMLILALVILVCDGPPVLYLSERMRAPDRAFQLLKFRTMTVDPDDGGVTGADKADRITASGRFLRATRLDELPQLFNILAGDLSFVGPRPPLRKYTEARPELYAEVLQSRPGLTGLATMVYHGHEAWILALCDSAERTHKSYLRRCVPRKAKLDLIYRRNASVRLDLWILWHTLGALFGTRRKINGAEQVGWRRGGAKSASRRPVFLGTGRKL